MNKILIIAKKELNSFFDSLMAYIMIVLFLAITGVFTWVIGSDIFLRNQADLQVFFAWSYWTLFVFIPAITMRMFAEENKTGTLELLLTKPVSDWQIVLGKFLGCFLLIVSALSLTIPYYFTIWKLGPIDHGATIAGYFGLLLMSAAYISIGLFTSSITNNQIVAFLLALFIGLFFHFIFGVLADSSTGIVGTILSYLSVSTHFDSVSRGVLDSKDLIYFISIILFGLVSSEIVLSKRNLTD